MKNIKFLALSLLTVATLGAGQAKRDENACAPEVRCLIKEAPYKTLYRTLKPRIAQFDVLLKAVFAAGTSCVNTAAYDALLAFANATAAVLPTGRVVITESDGTVIVDTSKGANNTCAKWQAKAINENHNTRVAILDAQLWPCGKGVETKFSSSVQVDQNYVALRAGEYLNSEGTVRLSVNAA